MNKIYPLVSLLTLMALWGCNQENVHTAKSVNALSQNDDIIKAAVLSKDGRFNLVADGQRVCLWENSQNSKPLHCLKGNEAQFMELLDISENNQFYLVSNQMSVRLYSLANHRPLGEWQVNGNIINDIDISANGSKILLGFRNGQASVIDVQRNKISTFDKHRLDINAVSLSDDGLMAFTGSSDKKAMLWHTDTGDTVHDFKHGSRVNHVSISHDGKVGFTLDAIKDRTFWDLVTGNTLSELDTSLRFFEFNDSRFSADNSLLLSGSPKQVIKLWRVADGALIAEWQSEVTKGRASILSVAYDGDDKIVTSNSDGLLEQWLRPTSK